MVKPSGLVASNQEELIVTSLINSMDRSHAQNHTQMHSLGLFLSLDFHKALGRHGRVELLKQARVRRKKLLKKRPRMKVVKERSQKARKASLKRKK